MTAGLIPVALGSGGGVALGRAMSGTLAGYYAGEHEVVHFGVLGLIAIMLWLLSPRLRRWMGGVR